MFTIAAADGSAPRAFAGCITRFSRTKSTRDVSHYRIVVEAHIARLKLTRTSHIYQQQSAPQIIEAILRRHGFTGHQFVFRLRRQYPQHAFRFQYVNRRATETTARRIQRGPGQTWLVFAGQSRQLHLQREQESWNDGSRLYAALDAMGYSDQEYTAQLGDVDQSFLPLAKQELQANSGAAVLGKLRGNSRCPT